MHRRSLYRPLAPLVVLAGMLLPGFAGGARADGRPAPTAPRWGLCPFEQPGPGAECATVAVPLDYGTAGAGPTLDLHVSRLRSGDPARRRGVLVINRGGPTAHLDDAASFGRLAPPDLLAAYDVVSFDQRGFGRSAPVTCGLTPAQQTVVPPFPRPGGEPVRAVDAHRVARQCAALAGPVLHHMGTDAVAADLDHIRAALGEERLSFLGWSYGSYLGTAYASRYPERTDRVVLDSAVDPQRAWRGQWQDGLGEGVSARFPDFARYAADRPDLGLGTDAPQVRATFLDLVARQDAVPLATPAGAISGTQLRLGLFGALYRDEAFPLLAELLVATRDGDGKRAGRVGSELQLWHVDENTAAGQLGVFCTDGRWPRSPARYAGEARIDAVRYPLTGGAGSAIWPCAFWPSGPDRVPVRANPVGPPNILVVNNRRDPATPHAGAAALRRQFGDRARLVSVDQGGHGAYLLGGDACADATGTAFLLGGVLPAGDVDCSSPPTGEAQP